MLSQEFMCARAGIRIEIGMKVKWRVQVDGICFTLDIYWCRCGSVVVTDRIQVKTLIIIYVWHNRVLCSMGVVVMLFNNRDIEALDRKYCPVERLSSV